MPLVLQRTTLSPRLLRTWGGSSTSSRARHASPSQKADAPPPPHLPSLEPIRLRRRIKLDREKPRDQFPMEKHGRRRTSRRRFRRVMTWWRFIRFPNSPISTNSSLSLTSLRRFCVRSFSRSHINFQNIVCRILVFDYLQFVLQIWKKQKPKTEKCGRVIISKCRSFSKF